jgi:hypothetical protein
MLCCGPTVDELCSLFVRVHEATNTWNSNEIMAVAAPSIQSYSWHIKIDINIQSSMERFRHNLKNSMYITLNKIIST